MQYLLLFLFLDEAGPYSMNFQRFQARYVELRDFTKATYHGLIGLDLIACRPWVDKGALN
jgi:hypothetical protein